MSFCNLTKNIPSSQCIGDSLRTINANFSALNLGLCDVPTILSKDNIDVSYEFNNQQQPVLNISSPSSLVYQTHFSSTNSVVTLGTLSFPDETTCSAYEFPYSANWSQTNPIGSFEVISTGIGYPQVTVFWMASASNNATVFPLNSATASINTLFDKSINALYREENTLYVGGSFTTINGVDTNKFAVIDLREGVYVPGYGSTGQLTNNPLSGVTKNLGNTGAVHYITKETIKTSPLLVIAGSFESPALGKGLIIYNKTLDLFYSFYVNGSIYNGAVAGSELYLVGEFDYINYGASEASETSGQRIYCNGVAKISLALLLTSPLNAIDAVFCANTLKTLKSPAKFNCVVERDEVIFVGGELTLKNDAGEIICKNAAMFESTGLFVPEWQYIFNKPILTMYIDILTSILYIGGEFNTAISHKNLYTLKEPIQDKDRYTHIVAFTLKILRIPGILIDWKPKFNGSVNKIIAHDDETTSQLYVMGNFTQVNNNATGHIAAITKASEFIYYGVKGELIPWNMHLSTAPPKQTNALIKASDGAIDAQSIYIGGNFTQINGEQRKYLGLIAALGQNVEKSFPSSVTLDVGGHIVSHNQKFAHNFTDNGVVRNSKEAAPFGIVNEITFPPNILGFEGVTRNQLCRFFIRRPGNAPVIGSLPATDDSYQESIHVLGWTVNFDLQKDN